MPEDDSQFYEAAKLVRLTSLCQAFQVLPRAGGLLDQDWYLVDGMEHVLKAQNEKQKLEQHKSKVRGNK